MVQATVARRDTFGTFAGGEVSLVTLASRAGITVRIMSYGAAIQSVIAPDRAGRLDDLVLGHDTLAGYLDTPQYFGATVGRVANRIAGGRFVLDGQEYRVPVNNGPNSLHGGNVGFDKVNWEVVALTETPAPAATLRYVSRDGDQGYPGTLTTTVTYRLDGDILSAAYRATTDRTTLVNLSNHVYWNLAGAQSGRGAMDHLLSLHADHFLPTDATAIPTGEIRLVAGTPFDFSRPSRIGARVRDATDDQIRIGRGYDHAWVVLNDRSSGALRTIAVLEDPASGRKLDIRSNQPGVQFYSGNFLDGTTIGKGRRLYRQGDGIALEPQRHPDTPNRPAFGSLRLEPGQTYRNDIRWRFSTAN